MNASRREPPRDGTDEPTEEAGRVRWLDLLAEKDPNGFLNSADLHRLRIWVRAPSGTCREAIEAMRDNPDVTGALDRVVAPLRQAADPSKAPTTGKQGAARSAADTAEPAPRRTRAPSAAERDVAELRARARLADALLTLLRALDAAVRQPGAKAQRAGVRGALAEFRLAVRNADRKPRGRPRGREVDADFWATIRAGFEAAHRTLHRALRRRTLTSAQGAERALADAIGAFCAATEPLLLDEGRHIAPAGHADEFLAQHVRYFNAELKPFVAALAAHQMPDDLGDDRFRATVDALAREFERNGAGPSAAADVFVADWYGKGPEHVRKLRGAWERTGTAAPSADAECPFTRATGRSEPAQ